MTREHKLAVVLGFGLLLFVGILVSDHFSATQRRGAADLAANTQIREIRSVDPISIQTIQINNRSPGARAAHPADLGSTASGDGVELPNGMIPMQPAQAVVVGIPAELYVLKDGETLYKICQSRYGNGNLWKELAEFNKGTVSNPTKLRKGTTIRLPSIHVLKGEAPVPIPPGGVQVMAAATDPNGLSQLPAQGGTLELPQAVSSEYVVQKGDTLGAIAARELGSAKKWESIFEANRDRLRKPTDLKIGQALRIPHDG